LINGQFNCCKMPGSDQQICMNSLKSWKWKTLRSHRVYRLASGRSASMARKTRSKLNNRSRAFDSDLSHWRADAGVLLCFFILTGSAGIIHLSTRESWSARHSLTWSSSSEDCKSMNRDCCSRDSQIRNSRRSSKMASFDIPCQSKKKNPRARAPCSIFIWQHQH
jgi:hypothetical protein